MSQTSRVKSTFRSRCGARPLRLKIQGRTRDLALCNLGVGSKLRAFDLLKSRTGDAIHGETLMPSAAVLQQETAQPARFEITEQTREGVTAVGIERRSA